MRPRILYISYDGMLEPLGQSQVLSYLERLTDTADISLISFEKPQDWSDAAKRSAATAALNILICDLELRRRHGTAARADPVQDHSTQAIVSHYRRVRQSVTG